MHYPSQYVCILHYLGQKDRLIEYMISCKQYENSAENYSLYVHGYWLPRLWLKREYGTITDSIKSKYSRYLNQLEQTKNVRTFVYNLMAMKINGLGKLIRISKPAVMEFYKESLSMIVYAAPFAMINHMEFVSGRYFLQTYLQ